MSREVAAAIVAAVIVLAVVLMALSWRRRRRRQAGLGTLAAVPAVLGETFHAENALYVATTRAGEPLERIAVAGLGFRARAGIGIHPEGVLLRLAGQADGFVPAGDLRGADRATWTIDRVVEKDGLVLLAWTLNGHDVDSYLRSDDPAALLAALRRLTPETPASAAELESELP